MYLLRDNYCQALFHTPEKIAVNKSGKSMLFGKLSSSQWRQIISKLIYQ